MGVGIGMGAPLEGAWEGLRHSLCIWIEPPPTIREGFERFYEVRSQQNLWKPGGGQLDPYAQYERVGKVGESFSEMHFIVYI